MTNLHLAYLPSKQTVNYGDKSVFTYLEATTNGRRSKSWNEFVADIQTLAFVMQNENIGFDDKIGVYSQNMPSYFITEFAAFALRSAVVPIYATSSPEQVRYIVHDAGIKLLFVGEQLQYDHVKILFQKDQNSPLIIIFDRSVQLDPDDVSSVYFDDFLAKSKPKEQTPDWYKDLLSACQLDDTACLIYTSGTTGEPKGVVLPHSCFIEGIRILHSQVGSKLSDQDNCLNFLPLAHIFEKIASYYCLYRGIRIEINKDPKFIQDALRQVHPAIMCSVPHFWEKIYFAILDHVNHSVWPVKKLFTKALRVGKVYHLDYRRHQLRPPFSLRIKYKLYDSLFFRKIKKTIGLDKAVLFPSGGAMLSVQVNEVLQSMGIPIYVGYGLTETTGPVSLYPFYDFNLESIGVVVPQDQVRIGDDDEIQVKGKNIMKEYYNKPDETQAAFTEDGFFRTGDAGRLENGVLFIRERIKDLYKTSNGKYIAPQALELKLTQDRFIDRAMLIADRRQYVTALIVPEYTRLKAYARKHHICYADNNDLLRNKEIRSLFDLRILNLEEDFAPFEKIIKYELISQPFTIETGELTNTLKIKRKFVAEKYKDIIDAMYQ